MSDAAGGDTRDPYTRARQRIAELFADRQSWDSHVREIAELQFPRAGRWTSTDANQGGKKHQKIYDEEVIFCRRTLAAGMMSGITSPAREWLRYGLADKSLMEYGPVKEYLFLAAKMAHAIFAASNTYTSLHKCYEELGAFGTWADIVLPDYDTVMHHYPMTFGEYGLGVDHRGVVNSLGRAFQMNVGAMAKQFGEKALSRAARNLLDRGQYSASVEICQLVQPRAWFDIRRKDPQNMPISSVYFEPGRDDGMRDFLSEGGFRRFPALTPRWDTTTASDIYGTSPGMDALGSVKELQRATLDKAQAIAYKVRPPLQVPTQYKERASDRLPGGMMFVDNVGNSPGIRTAWEVNVELSELLMSIEDVRGRIRKAYYSDLFLMLASQPITGGTTATEVAERHEEKLIMLGPVLERLHGELLQPLARMTYEQMIETKMLPPPPKELEGVFIEAQFIGILSQAQQAIGVNGMERMLTSVFQVAALKPGILDKINEDQVADDLADAFGVNPKLIRSDADVAAKREQDAKMQAAAQMAAAVPAMADAAKAAGEVNTDNLGNIMQGLQGYGTLPASPTN